MKNKNETMVMALQEKKGTPELVAASEIKEGDTVYCCGVPLVVMTVYESEGIESTKYNGLFCFDTDLDKQIYETYPLTKDMISKGMEAGLVKIVAISTVDGSNRFEGRMQPQEPVVSIGDNWFLAFGEKGEHTSVSDFTASVPKEDIVDSIYSVLCDFRDDVIFLEEYSYYMNYLQNGLRDAALADDGTMEGPENVCPVCGCDDLDYGSWEITDAGATIPFTCKHCGATGDMGYDLVFDGHYYGVVKGKNE